MKFNDIMALLNSDKYKSIHRTYSSAVKWVFISYAWKGKLVRIKLDEQTPNAVIMKYLEEAIKF